MHWCRVANRPERFACVYATRGCLELRKSDRFAHLLRAALRLQHFWRCKMYQLRRSWQSIAKAEAAAQAKWRRGPIALEDSSVQTEGRAGGLVITHDAWTQASAAPRLSADSSVLNQDYGPLRKRARATTANTEENIAAKNAWMVGAAGSTPTAAEVAFVFRRGRICLRLRSSPPAFATGPRAAVCAPRYFRSPR